MKKKEIRAAGLLFLTAVIWGFAMAAQRHGSQFLSPFTFNACRFILGGCAMLPLMLGERKRALKAGKKQPLLSIREVMAGCIAGAALFIASFLQQTGVGDAGTGKSGFLTALYVVLVPVMGVFLKKKTGIFTWLSLLLALPALYLLCIKKGERFSLAPADFVVLLGAFFWAGHILITDHFIRSVSAAKLCTVQFFSGTVLNLICALLFERDSITLSNLSNALWAVCYCGLLSTGLGYLLQSLGQKDCPPAYAALILSLESVFCVIAGALLLHEQMDARGYIGCGMMLLSVLLAQAGDLFKPKKEEAHV